MINKMYSSVLFLLFCVTSVGNAMEISEVPAKKNPLSESVTDVFFASPETMPAKLNAVKDVLKDSSVDIDALDATGETSLYRAVLGFNVDLTCMLLEHKASVNKAARGTNMTPLHRAVVCATIGRFPRRTAQVLPCAALLLMYPDMSAQNVLDVYNNLHDIEEGVAKATFDKMRWLTYRAHAQEWKKRVMEFIPVFSRDQAGIIADYAAHCHHVEGHRLIEDNLISEQDKTHVAQITAIISMSERINAAIESSKTAVKS